MVSTTFSSLLHVHCASFSVCTLTLQLILEYTLRGTMKKKKSVVGLKKILHHCDKSVVLKMHALAMCTRHLLLVKIRLACVVLLTVCQSRVVNAAVLREGAGGVWEEEDWVEKKAVGLEKRFSNSLTLNHATAIAQLQGRTLYRVNPSSVLLCSHVCKCCLLTVTRKRCGEERTREIGSYHPS